MNASIQIKRRLKTISWVLKKVAIILLSTLFELGNLIRAVERVTLFRFLFGMHP